MSLQTVTFVNKNRKNMEEIQDTLLAALDELFQASRDVIELADETENLKRIIEAIDYVSETSLKRAYLILGKLPEKKLRELGFQTETARRKAIIGYNLLSKITYIAYLATGDPTLFDLGALFYAASKALEHGASTLYILAGAALLHRGKNNSALALAAYGIRDALPINTPSEPPWKAPEKWAAYLRIAYMHEVGSKVNGELLTEWGILKALKEE